jgi:hypothetical protein
MWAFSTLLLASGSDALAAPTDACATRTDDVPCVHVRQCGLAPKAVFGAFKISNVTGSVPATQATSGTVCWDASGIEVSFFVVDAHIFSPWTKCDSTTWVNSDTVEVFVAPVNVVTDNPAWYYELNTVPTGAMYGGLVNNSRGNASTCIDENGCSTHGPMPCSGINGFAHRMTVRVSNLTGAWTADYFIPWEIFSPAFRPVAGRPWPLWRANFYRYSYPVGPNAAFDNWELNAWSPTHTPSFHEPTRFGVLVFDGGRKRRSKQAS